MTWETAATSKRPEPRIGVWCRHLVGALQPHSETKSDAGLEMESENRKDPELLGNALPLDDLVASLGVWCRHLVGRLCNPTAKRSRMRVSKWNRRTGRIRSSSGTLLPLDDRWPHRCWGRRRSVVTGRLRDLAGRYLAMSRCRAYLCRERWLARSSGRRTKHMPRAVSSCTNGVGSGLRCSIGDHQRLVMGISVHDPAAPVMLKKPGGASIAAGSCSIQADVARIGHLPQ